METKITYLCSICKKAFEKQKACKIHEAEHFNLSLEEYEEWHKLQEATRKCGIRCYYTKNETTDKAFDDSIKKLFEFEKAKNIKNEKSGIK